MNMPPKGSNDLNLILKARVVELKVKLDIKGSNLPSQVDAISKSLANKPVRLKVKLDASVKDLNKQIGDVTKTLSQAKTFKPLRIAVEIDVKGSADKIKKQLKEVHDVVSDFNKKYGEQLKQMKEVEAKAKDIADRASKPTNIKTDATVQGFNNIKSYAKQLSDAEKQLRGKFNDKQGLFSSTQIKDAQGNLHGFIATLERANGVVEKVKYSWNADKNQFQVIDRTTMTQTEKMVHKSMQALVDLQRELGKTGKASNELSKEYNNLLKAGNEGKLNMDMVKAFQTKVANAKEEVSVQKQLNDLKREERKLINDIKNAVKGTQGKFTDETRDLLKRTRTASSSDELKDLRVEYTQLNQKVKDYKQTINETQKIDKQREQALRQLTKYLRETNEAHGALSRDNIKAVQQLAQRARSTRQMAEVQKQLNSMYRQQQSNKDLEARESALRKLKTTMQEYGKALGKSGDTIELLFANKAKNIKGSLAEIEREISSYTKKIQRVTDKAVQDNLNRAKNSIVTNVSSKQIRSLIDEGDITKLKDYLSTTQKLDIATAKVSTNDKGITRITTTLASTGKTAKQVTYEIDSLNNKLRFLGQQDVFNRNANLGIFEQMKIALARVPVWMASMTVFYGSIHAFQSMATEILNVDKALTELKRVASDSINIDTVFEGAIGLSKELGNNIHDIMQAVNDLSRTYGEFNERQLLAVAKTAVLMSNVSDLSAEEATNTLVGTMNAFNIVAEDSIRIVDSLNEVDNDYAISTKQLATGLQKSSSTAKTFGVTLEESVGHITAIGAVTMESGNIIGNSLKTIYSRITTLDDAKSILESVGVGIYGIGEAGEKVVKPVNTILSELAGRWGSLSAEQRQNIAVTVAGRYQLSRFLALMNNWSVGTNATRTALSAQGSAMRENAKYMESFEARINKLKNAFTEMSLSMGEAFLGGAMLVGIEMLADLAEVVIKVVDNVGALPIIVGVIGLIATKMGAFSGVITRFKLGIDSLKASFASASAGARTFSGAMAGSMAVVKATAIGTTTAVTAGFRAMFTAIKGMMASTGIGLLFVALGYGIEKLIGYFQKQRTEAEKVEKANKQLVDSYRNTAGGLDNLIKKQDELQSKVDSGAIKEGTDAYNEYVAVTNELAQKLPTVVKYIDQSGLAHLKEKDAMMAQYDIAKKLSDLKNKETIEKFEKKITKETKAYQEQLETAKELEKQLKKLEKEDGKKVTTWDYDSKMNVTTKTDNTDEIQKTNIQIIEAEKEKAESIQKVMNLVQDTTLAYLESDQKLKSLTDAGKNVIEQMVQSNEQLLRYSEKGGKLVENNQKTVEKRGKELLELGQELGTFMADTYDGMTKGVTDPLELEKIRTNMDNLVKALPSTFFKLESLDNVDDLKKKFEGVMDIADQVKEGGGSFDSITASLQEFGFTEQEAKGYTAQLALQYDNTKIRQEAMTQAQNEGQESLENWVDTAIQAIDVSEQLFGIGDEDLNAMKSHIENLQALKTIYGENAENTDQWKASMEALSLFTGIPDDVIAKDLNYYKDMLELMGNIELQYDENTGALIGFNKEGLNPTQIAKLNEMIHLGREHGATIDLVTGKMYDLKTGTELVYDANKNLVPAVQEVKDAVAEKPTENGTKEALEETTNQAKTAKQELDKLKEGDLLDTTDNSPEVVEGKLAGTKDSLDDIKASALDMKNQNILNPSDTSPQVVATEVGKVDEKLKAIQDRMYEMKMKKIFGEDTGASTTTSQIDALTQAIQKASSGTQVLSTLNQMVGDSTVKVNDLMGKLTNIATNIGDLTSKLGALDGASQKVQNVAGALLIVREQIGGVLNGFVSSATTMSSSIVGAFMTMANAISAVVNIMITHYMRHSQSIVSMVNITRQGLSLMVSMFSLASTIIGSKITSIASIMVNEFQKGINILVLKASMIPKNIANAINSNIGAITSAMNNISKVVSNTRISPRVSGVQQVGAYANGGIVNKMELAWHGEEGAEAIIPLISKRRKRGIELWKEAGERLGIPSELIDFLQKRARGKGGQATGGGSVGMASSEGGDTGGGGDSGSSGIMTTSKYVGGTNVDGGYSFTALEMEDLQSINWNEREMTSIGGQISKLEAYMNRLNKNTLAYRNALKEVVFLNNKNLSIAQKELAYWNQRKASIELRLKQLGDTSKHTEAQRKEYNALVQAHEEAVGKVASLGTEVENIQNDIKAKSIEIFTDMIDEVVSKYDTIIDNIKNKVDNIDFKMDILELTDADNVEKKMDLLIDKGKELQAQLSYEQGKKNDLSKRYDEAVKKYGANSEQAKKIKEELQDAEESWEDAYISVLQNEKEIKDTRGEVADEAIDKLKDYYSNMKEMADKAYEEQIKAVEKEHEAKMELYDDEIDKINSVYDAKLKAMDADKAEANYQEELDEKDANRADIMNKIALLSKDTSLEGKKKLAELQKELETVNKDIAKFQQERQDELFRQQLEEQKQAQIDLINAQKEAEEENKDKVISDLESKQEQTNKDYDNIINDDAYWAGLKEDAVNGDFSGIQGEMAGMQANLLNMSKGTFTGLSEDFVTFADSVKKSVADLYKLDVKNFVFGLKDVTSALDDLAHSPAVEMTNGKVGSSTVGGTTESTWEAPKTSPTSSSSGSKNASKPATQDKAPVYYTVKKGDTLWDIAKAQYGNPQKWNNIAQANSIDDPRKLQIGKKLLIPFRDGGYTGDWAGNDGRVALLHKKENVFKEKDTKNLLDASKILRTISKYLPNISRSTVTDKLALAGGISNSVSYGDIHITVEGGDKKKAKDIAKELMDGLKKKGKG